MAVINKGQVAKTTSDASESSSEDKKGRVVDVLQDKSLPTGQSHKLDITEDAWEYGAPPKAGPQTIKLFLAKDGVICYDDDKDKEPGYGISIEGKIVDSTNGEFDGVTVFPRVNTFLGRGKNISTAAGLVAKLGYKVPEQADHLAIAKLIVLALKKEPTIKVECDWRGWSKLDSRVAFKNMEAFPKDEHGEPIHIVDYKSSKGQIEEIRAQLQVVHWYGKGEEVKAAKGSSASAPKGPIMLRPVQDADDGAQVASASVSVSTVPSDEELVNMLEEA